MTPALWFLYGAGCVCVGALLAAWIRSVVAQYRSVR